MSPHDNRARSFAETQISKALALVSIQRPHRPGERFDRAYHSDPKRILDIMGLLVRKQELSEYDVSDLFGPWLRPIECVEVFLSEYPAEYDMCTRYDAFEMVYPALAGILCAYANQPSIWERLLRRLIRRGANLHGPVYRNPSRRCINKYPCPIAKYGTPLDELVNACENPLAAQVAADGWLRILASEGCDPSSYLQEEFALHARDMQFTYPPHEYHPFDIPRQLHFQFGGHPSVFWDWWIDPASSATLIRAEFKFLVGTSLRYPSTGKPWEECWPFTYPKWYISEHGWMQGQSKSQLEALLLVQDQRATRRLRRKAGKLARTQSSKRPQSVPGAWPLA